MNLLANKKGLIFGVANARSLGWAIADACHQHGAELGISYLNERLKRRAQPLSESIEAAVCAPCDVQQPEQIDSLFEAVETKMGKIDFIVHSLAFAQREDLIGNFTNTSLEGFRTALEVSCFSLINIIKRSEHLLNDGASVLTLSYIGSQQYVTNYNIMGTAKAALESSVRYLAAELGPRGIRVNTLSAGPIKTLAAAGIPGFKKLLKVNAEHTALKRNVDPSEVGDAAVFLVSDLSRAITGTCLFVDCGGHFMGISHPQQPS